MNAELRHEKIGPLIEKYFQGRPEVSTENRIRILRLHVENMTLRKECRRLSDKSMHGRTTSAANPDGPLDAD